jgi:hypothetical protein
LPSLKHRIGTASLVTDRGDGDNEPQQVAQIPVTSDLSDRQLAVWRHKTFNRTGEIDWEGRNKAVAPVLHTSFARESLPIQVRIRQTLDIAKRSKVQ